MIFLKREQLGVVSLHLEKIAEPTKHESSHVSTIRGRQRAIFQKKHFSVKNKNE